jgi:anti-sigma regulatory factor (Ser/Thr protein kinase)
MPLAVSRVSTDAATRVELRLAARLDEVSALAEELRRLCRDAAVREELVSDLELAAVEAATNVVLHALHDRPDASFTAAIELTAGQIAVELADGGPAMEPGVLERPLPDDPLSDNGRGMAIIRSYADGVSYAREANVNRLRLTKNLD